MHDRKMDGHTFFFLHSSTHFSVALTKVFFHCAGKWSIWRCLCGEFIDQFCIYLILRSFWYFSKWKTARSSSTLSRANAYRTMCMGACVTHKMDMWMTCRHLENVAAETDKFTWIGQMKLLALTVSKSSLFPSKNIGKVLRVCMHAYPSAKSPNLQQYRFGGKEGRTTSSSMASAAVVVVIVKSSYLHCAVSI